MLIHRMLTRKRAEIILTTGFFSLVLVSCSGGKSAENNKDPERWYKGNTHTHTNLSDGNEAPEYVVNWYHQQGYNFLVLTDHNKFVDPDSVKMPADLREDFILIAGEEVSGKRVVHTTGLNVRGYVHPGFEYNSVTEVIQSHVDSVIAHGGIPIINHPNFRSGVQAGQIIPVRRLNLLELFNGHPSVYNWGVEGLHASVETKWDSLLTQGYKYYAVASDDAHHYDQFFREKANPGRGWIMVKSRDLSPGSITSAIAKGDFYASNGLILKSVQMSGKSYIVEIDSEKTKEELRSPYLTGNIVSEGKPGFTIEFIGENGRILQTTEGSSSTYIIKGDEPYVRCRVTYCRKRSAGTFELLYAWTQPQFHD